MVVRDFEKLEEIIFVGIISLEEVTLTDRVSNSGIFNFWLKTKVIVSSIFSKYLSKILIFFISFAIIWRGIFF